MLGYVRRRRVRSRGRDSMWDRIEADDLQEELRLLLATDAAYDVGKPAPIRS